MKNRLRHFFKEAIRKFDIDLIRFPHPNEKRRMQLLHTFGIDTIIDVGANRGQFANEIFYYNYVGTIHSFEPIKEAYEELEANSKKKKGWFTYNYALGSTNSEEIFNITNLDASSSFLKMKASHITAAKNIHITHSEKVTIKTLDSIWDEIFTKEPSNVFLKIDTQGFEKNVLLGALQNLSKITGIQIEMSLVELYEGEWLYEEIIQFLKNLGFLLFSVEPGFCNEGTGQLLQMDGIFYRPPFRPSNELNY
jgi:FkbM family methyltransferase